MNSPPPEVKNRLNNLLITGLPRCGKTTLVKKIIQNTVFYQRSGGFITEEIRDKGKRIGFEIMSIPAGEKGFLARRDFTSRHHVGAYGVNLENLEIIGCRAVKEAILSKRIIILDEIGKMELFSENFKRVLLEALDSPQKVLATIMEKRNPFADRVKKRNDVQLLFLKPENFERTYSEVKSWLQS